MKNSNDIIGNRSRDLRACGAVPQPTVPPRAPDDRSIRVQFPTIAQNFLLSTTPTLPPEARLVSADTSFCGVQSGRYFH